MFRGGCILFGEKIWTDEVVKRPGFAAAALRESRNANSGFLSFYLPLAAAM